MELPTGGVAKCGHHNSKNNIRNEYRTIRVYIVTYVRFPWLNNVSNVVTTLLRFLRYATILGGLASLSSNNVISSIVALATMDGRVYGYGLDVCKLLRIRRSGAGVCIWLRTPLRLEG
jgi:hypothetical protein